MLAFEGSVEAMLSVDWDLGWCQDSVQGRKRYIYRYVSSDLRIDPTY